MPSKQSQHDRHTKLTDRLHRHVDMLAELIGERNTAHLTGLESTRTYLRQELTNMGLGVTDTSFQVFDRLAINLEVEFPGHHPRLPMLVIGAHYDSVLGTPGADDNASAVAMLLEICREIAGCKISRPIRAVFFDCEEPPYFNKGEMGSQFHAANLRKRGDSVLGMICLESLGFYQTIPSLVGWQPWPLRWFSWLFDQRYVVIVSNLQSIRFGWKLVWRFATSGLFPFLPAALPVRWVPDIALSDHRGYWEQGFSALMITDTAHLRNPNYHRETDRLNTLDLESMTRVCRQLQRAVCRLCG